MNPRDAAPAAFDLESFLRVRREAVERALSELPLAGIPAALHRPIEYAVGVGGKRLRPILCASAWCAVTGRDQPRPEVYRAAAAVELIHAYSLVHDDLPFMDDDDVRRGRPATHRAFGSATATVAGAAMIVLAFRLLQDALDALDLPPWHHAQALAELGAAAGAAGMVGGQWLDLAAEGQAVPLDQLERIHALKTGALIRAAVVIGALCARVSADGQAALARYGTAIGLAFQIADDLLDARGDSATIGKTAGRDAALAKSTYPGLLGIDGAERLAHEQVNAAIGALDAAGLRTPELDALARYSVARIR